MTPSQRMGVSVVVIAVSLGVPTARAAPLQLVGELTVTNDTDRFSPDNPLHLSGGREFTLEIALPPLGRTTLAPSFWPEPGQSFTGPFVIDFSSPGAGLVEEGPLRVDGVAIGLWLTAPTGFSTDDGRHQWIFGRVPSFLEFGTSATATLTARPERDPPGIRLGEAAFRVDAIVPEPATVLLVGIVLGALFARPRRRLRASTIVSPGGRVRESALAPERSQQTGEYQ